MEKQNVIKYSFMIVPFKMDKSIKDSNLKNNDFFIEYKEDQIRYEKLYKHINNAIVFGNDNHSIEDYGINLEKYFPEWYKKELTFKVEDKGYNVKGYLKEVITYFFNSGIGFNVFFFVFDEKTSIDEYTEVINKLKKIDRDAINFNIYSDDKAIGVYSILEEIKNKVGYDMDFFFQHNYKEYVSSTMLNSFTFDHEIEEHEIFNYLECLKRSQPESYGVVVNEDDYLHPFKNIYWGFSSQGIGNVNYCLEGQQEDFIKNFNQRVRREYLLMVLILLNQQFTLMDFCIDYTVLFNDKSSFDDKSVIEHTNRLYMFKVQNTYTVVSHLEHYRKFYKKLYEKLNIDDILKEVESKQDAIYARYENEKRKQKERKEKKQNIWMSVFSVILSASFLETLYSIFSEKNWSIIFITFGLYTIAIVFMMIFLFKTNNKKDDGRK